MGALRVWTGVEVNTLGKYRLLVGIGRGGMAMVHLAVMHGLSGFNKLVVIKQVHQQFGEDPEVLGMFLDEARLTARLRHNNVVQTHEIGEDGGRHFMVMEYLDGQPLNRVIQRLGARRALPLGVHLRILADLLSGLQYAHDLADYDGTLLGVVHRDVTPQNVFVTYDGVVKILDFGIAKARSALAHTGIGVIKGKIAYMAPELICGATVDRRADIFAVGVMLWEAATGTRPWKGVPELTVLKNVVDGQFPSARAVRPDIPERLDAILRKALSRNPEDRHATAAELQADLEGYLEATGERTLQRDIGKLIAKHFEAERAELQLIVEEQLQRQDEAPPGVPALLPIVEHPTTHGPDSGQELLPGPQSENPSAPHTRPAAFVVAVPAARPPGSWRGSFARAGAIVAGAALIGALGWALTRAPARGDTGSPVVVTAGGPGQPSAAEPFTPASPPVAPPPSPPAVGVTPEGDRAVDASVAFKPASSPMGYVAPVGAAPPHTRMRHLDDRNPYHP